MKKEVNCSCISIVLYMHIHNSNVDLQHSSEHLTGFQCPSIRYVSVTSNQGINDFFPLTRTTSEEATYLSVQF
jgi:hypothetical protein